MTTPYNTLHPIPKFQTIGHRGVAGLAPENTLAGFKLAQEIGLNWVEFDTQPCLTGEWMVLHDETLDRTSTGTGALIKTPYSFLSSLDAGSWFNSQYHQEKIPLLSEALDILVRLNLHVNIEIKGHKLSHHPQSLRYFLDILEAHWPKTLHPPLISSFDVDVLLAFKKLAPHLLLGYLVKEYQLNTLHMMKSNHFFSLHCDYRNVFSDPLRNPTLAFFEILKSGFPLLLYTVNDPRIAQILLNAGATAIFSDSPHLMISNDSNKIAMNPL